MVGETSEMTWPIVMGKCCNRPDSTVIEACGDGNRIENRRSMAQGEMMNSLVYVEKFQCAGSNYLEVNSWS